jgi:hypothetical protein
MPEEFFSCPSCGPLTPPIHFMSLILIPKQMCTSVAHVATHMDLQVMEFRISAFVKKKCCSYSIELLNKIYKLHQSSIIYLKTWFVFKKKKKNVKDSLCDHTQIIWLLFQIHGITVSKTLAFTLYCHSKGTIPTGMCMQLP